MPDPQDRGPRYKVICSAVITEAFRQLQRRASRSGQGEAVTAAFRHIIERLQVDPTNVGEPLYRLPALRMLVYCVAIRPLYVDFAVCEDRPLVFIKAVKLLAGQDS
jgi:hypothetical protein